MYQCIIVSYCFALYEHFLRGVFGKDFCIIESRPMCYDPA